MELTKTQLKKIMLAQVEKQFNSPTINKLFRKYFKKCKEWELGRNRLTFIFSNFVVKLPVTQAGFGDNDWEGSVSNNPNAPYNDCQIQYARTRLVYVGERNDIPVLFMQRVEPVTGKEIVKRLGREPKWCMVVDGGQVGFNRKGLLVAYDYGPY